MTLWKYGGIYLDLDVIVVKPLSSLPKNFAGAESLQSLGSSVLAFDSDSSGHKISTHCLLDLQNNFNGQKWGHNGPGVISRVASEFCVATNVTEILESSCAANLKIFPPQTFYPIHWTNSSDFFKESTEESAEKLVEDSYVVHVWNKMTSDKQIHVDTDKNVLYSILARKFCPKVFKICTEYF